MEKNIRVIEKVLDKFSIKKGKLIKLVLGKFDFDDDTPNDENTCDNSYIKGKYSGILFNENGNGNINDISQYRISLLPHLKYSLDNIKLICLERTKNNEKKIVSYKKEHMRTMLREIFDVIKTPVIGEGSFGCVIKPSLHCNSPLHTYKNKVSKLMFRNEAINEINQAKKIRKIKGIEDYAIIPSEMCLPKKDNNYINAVKKCGYGDLIKGGSSTSSYHSKGELSKSYFTPHSKNSKRNKGSSDTLSYLTPLSNEPNKSPFNLILYEYGGKTFEDVFNNFYKTDEETKKQILTSIINLIDGLIFFRNKNIIHGDIHFNNILYNSETRKSKYIDFGLMETKNDIINKCESDEFNYNGPFPPPEIHCLNKKDFNKENCKIKYKDYKYINILNKFIETFDSFCFSSNFIIYLNPETLTLTINKVLIKELIELFTPYCEKDILNRESNLIKLKNGYRESLIRHNMYLEFHKASSPKTQKKKSKSNGGGGSIKKYYKK